MLRLIVWLVWLVGLAAMAAPHAVLSPAPVGAVRWTQGFWADRFTLSHQVVAPEMAKTLELAGNGGRAGKTQLLHEGRTTRTRIVGRVH